MAAQDAMPPRTSPRSSGFARWSGLFFVRCCSPMPFTAEALAGGEALVVQKFERRAWSSHWACFVLLASDGLLLATGCAARPPHLRMSQADIPVHRAGWQLHPHKSLVRVWVRLTNLLSMVVQQLPSTGLGIRMHIGIVCLLARVWELYMLCNHRPRRLFSVSRQSASCHRRRRLLTRNLCSPIAPKFHPMAQTLVRPGQPHRQRLAWSSAP